MSLHNRFNNNNWLPVNFRFYPFYHNYVKIFISQLKKHGIEGLLKPDYNRGSLDKMLDRQNVSDDFFENEYDPSLTYVDKPYPADDIDFSSAGGYSIYNWELFFHAPMLIANHLMNNQKFDEAMKWFHFIFDPTETEDKTSTEVEDHDKAPERFWRLKPFHEYVKVSAIEAILKNLDKDEDLQTQVDLWRSHPFNPHAIARIRNGAYMKNTVMKYLDNLIAWGDRLFERDTIESINEATQLYIIAAQILGRRPELIDRKEQLEPKSFAEIKNNLDVFSNALVLLENQLKSGGTKSSGKNSGMYPSSSTIRFLYFCVPRNEKLLSYWDIVADRLFKIRNCMNIRGIVRQLPMFEPPIDPAMLVKAAAAGISISDAMANFSASRSPYKYEYLYQKTIELVQDVKTLGGALLVALEKKDAEELAELRENHQLNILNLQTDLKNKTIEEAQANMNALEHSKLLSIAKQRYYISRKFLNQQEIGQKVSLIVSSVMNTIGQAMHGISAVMHPIPDATAGVAGPASSPVAVADLGGGNKLGKVFSSIGTIFNALAAIQSTKAQLKGNMASYFRRFEEWQFQAGLARLEEEQVNKQLEASRIRLAIAEKDLSVHENQIEQSEEAIAFMKDKFTNKQLYNWMVSRVSSLYFEGYKLAHQMAKKAEAAYEFELGISKGTAGFIKPGHWDSLKKGLLAGERLHLELKRLDMAYTDNNERELEITKHYSLALFNQSELIRLRETGTCNFSISEILYDLDHPGHYMRRIKNVSVTIPSVSGPFTGVTANLILGKNKYRHNTQGDYDETNEGGTGNDSRFIYNPVAPDTNIIALSTGQSDSGVFEPNLSDNRYLPFEGAGAVSEWKLEFPGGENRTFDYSTISDIIVTIRYTARFGGDVLKSNAQAYVDDNINEIIDYLADQEAGLFRAFSLKSEFPAELHKFLAPDADETEHETKLEILNKHFPFVLRNKELDIKEVSVVIKLKDGFSFDTPAVEFSLKKNGTAYGTAKTLNDIDFEGLYHADFGSNINSPIDEWDINTDDGAWVIKDNNNDPATPKVAVDDIYFVFNYGKKNT